MGLKKQIIDGLFRRSETISDAKPIDSDAASKVNNTLEQIKKHGRSSLSLKQRFGLFSMLFTFIGPIRAFAGILIFMGVCFSIAGEYAGNSSKENVFQAISLICFMGFPLFYPKVNAVYARYKKSLFAKFLMLISFVIVIVGIFKLFSNTTLGNEIIIGGIILYYLVIGLFCGLNKLFTKRRV